MRPIFILAVAAATPAQAQTATPAPPASSLHIQNLQLPAEPKPQESYRLPVITTPRTDRPLVTTRDHRAFIPLTDPEAGEMDVGFYAGKQRRFRIQNDQNNGRNPASIGLRISFDLD